MSDAAAPGPSSEGPDDDPGAPRDEAADVPTGQPDEALVDEAASVAGSEPEAAEPEAAEPEAAEPQAAEPETRDDEDTAGDTPTGLPDEELVDEAAPDQPTPVDDAEPDLATVAEGVAGARAEIAELRRDLAQARSGVESMLPDLAAAAREETVTVALAELAREETVAAGNARIQRSLDEMVRLTRRADEHVAELHGENQRLRAGELASATLPMIRDLVRLHDEVSRLSEASHPEARADLELVGSRLLDTLARWGLTPFAPTAGEALDASKHQGVGRVPSSDGEPGTVATVRRPGFAHDDGRTFRAAEVEVYAPPPAPPAGPSTEET